MDKKLKGFQIKPILRLLASLGVIAFAAGVMATSCDNDGGGNNNNNNNNSGSGGNGGNGGDGGSGYSSSNIKITSADAANVTISGKTISIKAAAFPAGTTPRSGSTTDDGPSFYNTIGITTVANKVFDIEYDGATGGLLLVANGDVAKPEDVVINGDASPAGFIAKTYDGIHLTSSKVSGSSTAVPTGLSFFSMFGSTNTPANTDADKAPFAFTAVGEIRPVFWCRATASGINEDITMDVSAITGFGAKTLAGAHKASCYVATTTVAASTTTVAADATGGLGTAAKATAWFAATGNVKKSIQVAVSAVKTDAKTILQMGLPGANDIAKLQSLEGGLTKDEMKAVVEANKDSVAFGRYTIKITQ